MIPDKITSDLSILSVILFGSQARGDSDSFSDRDVCVFTRPNDYPHLERVRGVLEQALDVKPDALSIYPASIVREMGRAGSLFLWHLRLEGQILFDRNDFTRDTFTKLPPFCGYQEELRLFDALLLDIEATLASDGILTEIDLHLLQSIARNICILLTSCAGSPTFGRVSAVVTAASLYPGMPYDECEYEHLCEWHLAYLRGKAVPGSLPERETCLRYVASSRELVRFAESVLQ